MRPITLIVVLNRWPTTLSSTLAALGPYVAHKVAIVDQSAGLARLEDGQSAYFDRVRYAARGSLDELRNASLALARELDADAWGLSLDSDESIDTKSILALHALAAGSNDVSAYLLPCYNYVGLGRWITTYTFRLFRLADPIVFSHTVHESISPALVRLSLNWRYAPVPIQHLDFLDPVAGKRDRYRALLRAAIERGEDLAFLKTLYAIECIWVGDDVLALRHLDEAIALAAEPSHAGRFSGRDDFPVSIKALHFTQTGRLTEAEALWRRLYDTAEPRVKAECALGLATIATQQGDQERALQWVETSLSTWATAEGYFSRATTLCALKQRDSAYRDVLAGIDLNPMVSDHRIQGHMPERDAFGLQCLLNPDFRGLPHLVRAVATL